MLFPYEAEKQVRQSRSVAKATSFALLRDDKKKKEAALGAALVTLATDH